KKISFLSERLVVMGYNHDNFIALKRQYDQKRNESETLAASRLEELHALFPEVKQIDVELAKTGSLIMAEIEKGKDGLEERLDNIRQDNELLMNERAKILERNGYPANYSDVKYDCEKCKDTGFVGATMCSCMRFQLSLANLDSSGLGKLLETQSFDSFSLKYYENDSKAYSRMSDVLRVCSEYADNFDDTTRENLLFYGPTGLGKTHLSTAIAGVIIDRGFEVVYESAQNMFDEVAAERFGRSFNGVTPDPGRFFSCDLLIIDDLGTEVPSSLSVSTLYNVINSRIIAGKPMIINTNCDSSETRKLYGDRIYSRFMGHFTLLSFVGRDVRLQKLTRG
ncbi:MAG: ATP-binding protein, partial [Clostridia bacterium]|nr:ATP-binding protein [Clostridia bacterium]